MMDRKVVKTVRAFIAIFVAAGFVHTLLGQIRTIEKGLKSESPRTENSPSPTLPPAPAGLPPGVFLNAADGKNAPNTFQISPTPLAASPAQKPKKLPPAKPEKKPKPKTEITGSVLNNTDMSGHAKVFLVNAADPYVMLNAYADDAGNFRLHSSYDIAPGEYLLWARSSDEKLAAEVMSPLTIRSGDTLQDLKLTMGESAEVDFKLTDSSTNALIRSATISIPYDVSASSDKAGEFSLTGLPHSDTPILIQAWNYDDRLFFLRPGKGPLSSMNVSLAKAFQADGGEDAENEAYGSLSGIFYSAEGKEDPSCLVEVLRPKPTWRWGAQEDALIPITGNHQNRGESAQFHISKVPLDTPVNVRVRCLTGRADLNGVVVSSRTKDWTHSLKPTLGSHALRLRVMNADGTSPVPNADVEVLSPDSVPTNEFFWRTDGEGRLELPHLPPGPYEIRARHNGDAAAVTDIFPAADANSETVVRLQPRAKFLGKVTGGDGRSIQVFTVAAFPKWGSHRTPIVKNVLSSDSTFSLDLIPGTYAFAVSSPGRGARFLKEIQVKNADPKTSKPVSISLPLVMETFVRIVDQKTRNPVAGAVLASDPWFFTRLGQSSPVHRGPVAVSVSDQDGYIEVTNVPSSGQHRAFIYARGYLPAEISISAMDLRSAKDSRRVVSSRRAMKSRNSLNSRGNFQKSTKRDFFSAMNFHPPSTMDVLVPYKMNIQTVHLKPISPDRDSDAILNGAFTISGQIWLPSLGLSLKTPPKSGAKTLTAGSVSDFGPAAQAGVEAGDTILAIDGKNIGAMTVNEAIGALRNPAGRHVRLTLAHGSAASAARKPREVTLSWREE